MMVTDDGDEDLTNNEHSWKSKDSPHSVLMLKTKTQLCLSELDVC